MARQSTNEVSLFPFLAVLVCAMGALIFLLLVTTRRIRNDAIAAAKVEASVPDSSATDDSPPPAEIALGAIFDPPPPPIPTPPAVVPEPVDPNDEVREQIATLKTRLADRQRQSSEKNALLARAKDSVQRERERLDDLTRRKQSVQTQVVSLRQQSADHQDTLTAESEQIEETRRRIQAARARQAGTDSQFAYVAFDGVSGTVRRPILIECTQHGFRFIPENVDINATDIEGFFPDFNPLLAGASELVRYWAIKDRQSSRSGNEPEPYVLLLVRPSGSLAYYAARRMLNRLGTPFGYELLEEDRSVKIPSVDPQAQAVCQKAVTDAIAARDRVSGTRRMARLSNGRVIRIGRDGRVHIERPAGGANPDEGAPSLLPGRAGPSNSFVDRRNGTDLPGQRRPESKVVSIGEAGFSPSELPEDVSQGMRSRRPFSPKSDRDQAEPSSASAGQNSNLAAADGGRIFENFADRPGNNQSGDERANIADAVSQFPDFSRTAPPMRAGGNGDMDGEATNSTNVSGESLDAPVNPSRPSDPGMIQPGQPLGRSTLETAQATAGAAGHHVQRATPDSARTGRSASPSSGGPMPQNIPVPSLPLGRSSASAASTASGGQPRNWGQIGRRSTIAFEKQVTVFIDSERIVVGSDLVMALDKTQAGTDLAADVIKRIDEYALSWGPPPLGLHWMPAVRFLVSPGGNQHVERIRAALNGLGVRTTTEFTFDQVPDEAFGQRGDS